MKYAKNESKKIGIEIISKDVSSNIVKLLDSNSIYEIEKDNNGNIESIDYNPKIVNEVLSLASKISTDNFKKVEKKKDGVITKLPFGLITNNIFLENLGPNIPVRILLDGNVLSSLKTDVREYGINSALIQISVRIEANIDIIIPFRKKNIKIVNDIPISIKIIEGNVSSLLSNNY